MLSWYQLNGIESIAAILQESRRGIYVLEFSTGERYVGQAEDVVKRFAQHRHGGSHHEPWSDITAFGFLPVIEGSLAECEYAMFCQQKSEGFILRNKTWNYDHSQPSPLDAVIPVEIQQHWSTGLFHPPDREALEVAANRPQGPEPKLFSTRRGRELLCSGIPVHDAVVDNLARIILAVIPQPTETEGRFWNLSDYPSTAGGRFATLNVGNLELAYFPRKPWQVDFDDGSVEQVLYVVHNAIAGTFVSGREEPTAKYDDGSIEYEEDIGGHLVCYINRPNHYSLPTDGLCYPLGAFDARDILPEGLAGIRTLAIRSMRNASARLNARSHSGELSRRIYKRMLEILG